MMVKGKQAHFAVKLIEVNHDNKIKCYTKKSVDKKLEAMQNRIDFLQGQNTRLKKYEKELKLWNQVVAFQPRWIIRGLVDNYLIKYKKSISR